LNAQQALSLKLHPTTRELTMTMEEQILERGMKKGLEQGREEGLEQGLEKGLRQKALEDARKMLAKGCDWAFITEITGIRPEDLT
jgi:predicted transposase/invertase (TIGR01784 family)